MLVYRRGLPFVIDGAGTSHWRFAKYLNKAGFFLVIVSLPANICAYYIFHNDPRLLPLQIAAPVLLVLGFMFIFAGVFLRYNAAVNIEPTDDHMGRASVTSIYGPHQPFYLFGARTNEHSALDTTEDHRDTLHRAQEGIRMSRITDQPQNSVRQSTQQQHTNNAPDSSPKAEGAAPGTLAVLPAAPNAKSGSSSQANHTDADESALNAVTTPTKIKTKRHLQNVTLGRFQNLGFLWFSPSKTNTAQRSKSDTNYKQDTVS